MCSGSPTFMSYSQSQMRTFTRSRVKQPRSKRRLVLSNGNDFGLLQLRAYNLIDIYFQFKTSEVRIMYHYHFDWKLFEFSMMLLNYKCKSLSKCLLVQMSMLAILIFETIRLSQPDGLILYNEGKDNDFIAIELKQGHLHYTYNMGWMKTSHLSSFSSLWRSGTGRWLWKTTLQPRWQTTSTTQFGSGDQVGKFRSTENNLCQWLCLEQFWQWWMWWWQQW